jgi:hypothetical protein
VAKHRAKAGDAPIGALNMANQYAIVALELLSHYKAIWDRMPPGAVPDPARTRQENAERVITITKAVFILTLSAMEFGAKQALAGEPSKLPLGGDRVYLRRIIAKSREKGWLPIADETGWRGVIELRNTLVHNNGIAETTEDFALPNGPTISLVSGRMIQGNLRFLPEVTLWASDAFAKWADAFLR